LSSCVPLTQLTRLVWRLFHAFAPLVASGEFAEETPDFRLAIPLLSNCHAGIVESLFHHRRLGVDPGAGLAVGVGLGRVREAVVERQSPVSGQVRDHLEFVAAAAAVERIVPTDGNIPSPRRLRPSVLRSPRALVLMIVWRLL
jgi:hypothetical protein